ncbi:ABC transporter substrate-binding protein [Bifidobacterium sp. ESL0690]|uniref:peptide ABC transporter substrate-binding protein n=1 Tax=Bifidobacterium sp. ESL0690 TaxID=2983214 RepID=UPI0023F782C3|nr:ABC transporter substrate-binding protein [Bifidobacterium sp. ESL0690]WEV47389.1 ABC transporter substrate-binding protein [Bifidobacterium sp. ESL0690]
MSTRNTIKTAIAGLALTLCVSMALAGCGGSTGGTRQSDPSSASGSGQPVVVNNVEPAAGLIPSDTDDTAGWKVVTQLFEGLVTFGKDGKLVNAGAQSITPNADASQYTITLKPGLTFSNGERITAETYAKSWSFAANAANGMMGASIFSTIAGYDALQNEKGDPKAQLSGLHAVDDNTLKVDINGHDSSFNYKVGDVAFLPMPSSAFADIKAFGEHPVGNGPYKLASWTHDREIRLTPSKTYKGPRKPANSGVTFKLYTNVDSAYSDLEGGNLDVLDAIPNSALTTFRTDKSVTPYVKPGPAFKSFTIPQNLKHFTGEEGRLRREAISLSIDRKDITTKVLHGTAKVATDFTAPTIAGYSTKLTGSDVIGYNQKKARELWKKADAIAPFDGQFRLAYSADSGFKPWVEAIVNSIKNTLGINAAPYAMPTQKEFSGAIHNRTINAAFVQGLQSDYPHPEGYLVQAYDSSAADGKGLNNGDYKSQEFDSLIDKAAAEPSLTNSITTYQQAEETLLRDLPVIPLWYANVAAGSAKNVKVDFNYMGLPEYEKITK